MAMTREVPARRPGGRSARVRAAVIDATLAELAESGYSGVSLDDVAAKLEAREGTSGLAEKASRTP